MPEPEGMPELELEAKPVATEKNKGDKIKGRKDKKTSSSIAEEVVVIEESVFEPTTTEGLFEDIADAAAKCAKARDQIWRGQGWRP